MTDASLQGRTFLVTGAGDGIGRAVAIGAAAAGATCLLAGRTVAPLESTFDAIVAVEGAPEPAIVPIDLATGTADTAAEIAAAVDEQFGVLHGLVHCAGALGPRTPLQNYPDSDWDTVMATNVTGAFHLTRALLPHLQAADYAAVIFTSSSVGRAGRAYWGAYAVSKFATEGLMQVLADELANTSRVRVNSVNPGGTRTRMRAAAYPLEDPATLDPPEARVPFYLRLLGPDGRSLNGLALDAREPWPEGSP